MARQTTTRSGAARQRAAQRHWTLYAEGRLTRFDKIMLTVIAGLVLAVGITVLLADFSEPGPRVAFLSPAYGGRNPNIWLADPQNPSAAQQVTFSPQGIYDFSPSPDGRYIAFSERDSGAVTTELKLLDLNTGALSQLTNCAAEDADCKSPVWRADGKMIAYERQELNSTLTDAGVGPVRVWLIDLLSGSNRPLFNDSQILGYSPRWSGDGSRIAVFDRASGGILIYNFLDGSSSFIPSRYGEIGSLSPDGLKIVFPEMTRKGNQMFAHLKIADLGAAQFTELTSPQDPVDDVMPAWNPDGERLAIARKYTDDRFTRGHQVYLLNMTTGQLDALVIDPRYNSSFFNWNPAGDALVMQRFPELDETGQLSSDGRPEIWTYHLDTKQLIKIAVDAFQPRWVP